MHDLTGRIIKGYELHERIGLGGFAAVYRAHQAVLKRDVAIKIIHPEYANQPAFVKRFEVEAQLVARLDHLHIVPLFDYWRDPDGAYLVMRWIRGGSMREVNDGRPWPLTDALRLVRQISAALMVAHRRGIVHRDIKPDNVLLDEEKNFYLSDFGIAKEVSADQEPDRQTLGSPPYMSPEQIQSLAVTPQSDVYSLGIVLFEVVTGGLPFIGPTHTAILNQHINDPMPSALEAIPDMPIEIDHVIWRATAKSPKARFKSVIEFAESFEQAVKGLSRPAVDIVRSTSEMQAVSAEGGRSTLVLSEADDEPENPYKGLRAFEEADAGDFYGRTALINQFLKRFVKDDRRFLAVVGPSGSGKSSVVRAGLIPALRHWNDDWFFATIVPTAKPFLELEKALLGIAVSDFPVADALNAPAPDLNEIASQVLPGGGAELVLFVDQFEELFTLVEDEAVRKRFITLLASAAQAADGRVRVVLTLRADYYDRPLLYPALGAVLRDHTEVILPLDEEQMREAIVEPAKRAGLTVERGLVELILSDISDQPGALPLLQYALTDLFENRTEQTLTIASYNQIGGVTGALAQRAETIFATLGRTEQAAARQLLLRLVHVGEGVDDTRRRALRHELALTEAMETVIDQFGIYRLLTFDRDPTTHAPTVEIAHEALIREWGRLKDWLNASRADLNTHQLLIEATAQWQKGKRDTSFLATGRRLVQFETLLDSASVILNDEEKAFLSACQALRRRSVRRVQVVVTALTIFAVVSMGLAIFAFIQEQRAEDARADAIDSRDRADEQARLARSRELSVQALTRIEETDLALLLSVEALRIADTFEARNSLLSALGFDPFLEHLFPVETGGVRSLALSPDGELLAGGNSETIWIWNLATGSLVNELRGHTGWVNSLDFSEDGRRLASGSEDGIAKVWDVATGELVIDLVHSDEVWTVDLSPDGQQLASGSLDGKVYLWSVEDSEPLAVLLGHEDAVYRVVFSPDGQHLASAGGDMAIRLWDVETGEPTGELLAGHTNWVFGLAFSNDGRYLVSGGADRTLIAWDMATQQMLGQVDSGHLNWIRSVAFNPANYVFAVGSADATGSLWSIANDELRSLGFSLTTPQAAVWSVAFGPEGKLVAGGEDSRVMAWNLAAPQLVERQVRLSGEVTSGLAMAPDSEHMAVGSIIDGDNYVVQYVGNDTVEQLNGHVGPVLSVDLAPDGQTIVSASADMSVGFWDVGSLSGEVKVEHAGVVRVVAYSPDGSLVASGADDGRLILWDTATHEPLSEMLPAHNDSVFALAFSPDGHWLASGSRDGSINLWDVTTQDRQAEYQTGHTDAVTMLAFSPDGSMLASGSRDNTVLLWEVGDTLVALRTVAGHRDWVSGIAFSDDGSMLVSGSHDTTVMIWDIVTGSALGQPLTRHSDWVTGIEFSPDGGTFVSSGRDGTIVFWKGDIESWLATACDIANRPLTNAEWERYLRDEPYQPACASSR